MKTSHPIDETVTVQVDGAPLTLVAGSSVAAALAARMPRGSRRSVSGEMRSAFCGMGICHECRCTVDGLRRLACQTVCTEGMQIESVQREILSGERND